MAGVAVNGSNITESTKEGHVTYTIESYVPKYCAGYDPDTNLCVYWQGGYWESSGTGSTGAKIKGTVSSSSKAKINGAIIARVDDSTNETWEASPPIPSSNSSTRYTPTSAISGSGQGKISSGSTKTKIGGKGVALIGSEVTTCLGTTTTIKDGNSKIQVSS
ncbi:hypothetical protein BSK59_12880 [Paenibacillus odorifer]|uniref:hypothetical protein n=1 Tax=Paenibacillus odorifer TaxID=189426 RepID=UPI00096FB3EB|nr:hypothetical protein [Paenibacillus odorifer]OME55368.1 hypothetical protein BSK59_12880 [Paenibacillus odorifer]